MKKVVLLSGVLAAGLASVPTAANAASPIAPGIDEVNLMPTPEQTQRQSNVVGIQGRLRPLINNIKYLRGEGTIHAFKDAETAAANKAAYAATSAANKALLEDYLNAMQELLAALDAYINNQGVLAGVLDKEFKFRPDKSLADLEGQSWYQFIDPTTFGTITADKPNTFKLGDVETAIGDATSGVNEIADGFVSDNLLKLLAKRLGLQGSPVYQGLVEDTDVEDVEPFEEAFSVYFNFNSYFEDNKLKEGAVATIKAKVGDINIKKDDTKETVDQAIYEYVVANQLPDAFKAVNNALYEEFKTLKADGTVADTNNDEKSLYDEFKVLIGEAGSDVASDDYVDVQDILGQRYPFADANGIYDELYKKDGNDTELILALQGEAEAAKNLNDLVETMKDTDDRVENFKALLTEVNHQKTTTSASVEAFKNAANVLAVKALNGAIETFDLAGKLQEVEDLVSELTGEGAHHDANADPKTHWKNADHNITAVAEVVTAKAAAEAELEAFKAIYNTTTTDNVLNTPLNAVIAWANRNGALTENSPIEFQNFLENDPTTAVDADNTLDKNVEAVLNAIADYEQAVMKAELIYDMDDLRAHRDDLVANVKANIGHANLKQLILDCVVAEGEQGFKVDFTNLYRTYQKPVVEQNNKKFGTGTGDLNFETFEAEVVRLHKWLANMQAAIAAETYVIDEGTGEPALDADGNKTVDTHAGDIKLLNDKLVLLDAAVVAAAEKEGYYDVASIQRNDGGATTTATVTFSETAGKFKTLWGTETADYETTCAEIQAAFLTINDEVESIDADTFEALDGDLDTHLKHTQYLAAWQKANYDALLTLTKTINERYDEFRSVQNFVNKYGVDTAKTYWDLLKEGAGAELEDLEKYVYVQTLIDFRTANFFDASEQEPAEGEMYDNIQKKYNAGTAACWKVTDNEAIAGFSEWNKVEEANANLEEGATPTANVPAGYLATVTKAGITETSVTDTTKYEEEANAGIATAEENLAGNPEGNPDGNPEGNAPEAGDTTPEVKKVVYGDLQKAIRALFEKLTENEIANKKLHDDYYAAINDHLKEMYDTCVGYEDVNARDFQQTTALFGFITFTGKYFEEGKCEDDRTFLGYKQLQDKLAAFNGDEQAAYNAIQSDAFLKGAAPYNTDAVDSADEKKADIDAQIELLWNHIATDQLEAYVQDVEDYYAEKLADAEALDKQCDEEADEEHNHDYHEGAECGWCKTEVAKQLANIRALKTQYAALVAEYHNDKTPAAPEEGNEGNENQGMESGLNLIGELPNVEEQPTNVPATNLVPGQLQDNPTHSAAGCAKEHVAQFKAFVEVATTAIDKWYEDFVKADEAHKAKLDEAKAIVDKQVHNLDHLAETADFFLQNFTAGDLVAADAWAVEYAQSKVARPDYLDLSGVLEAEHPFEAYVEALREAHLAAVAAAQAAYDKHQYTLLVKIGEEAEGVKAADDFLKEVNANVAAYAGILQHITAVETVLHTIKVDTGCDEGDAEFNETIEDIQAQLDGMRAFVQKHYEGKLEVQPYAEEDGELKSFIESVADYEEALESLEDQIAELKHAIAEETEKVKTSGRWADNLLLKLAEVEMAFDEAFAKNEETGEMPLAGAENFKPEATALADAIKDLHKTIDAADSHAGILNSTTNDRTYVPGGHSVYENRLHFLEDIKNLAEDVQSLKDDVAANEAAKSELDEALAELEEAQKATNNLYESFEDAVKESLADKKAAVDQKVKDADQAVDDAYKAGDLIDAETVEQLLSKIEAAEGALANFDNEAAKAEADYHMAALTAALDAARDKFEGYGDDPFTTHLTIGASEELRNLDSAAETLKYQILGLYNEKELAAALDDVHQQHAAIEADLAALLAKYDRLCAEAHHLSNGKDIYSDQEYFTIGFFRQANDGVNVQGEEMFQNIQITNTPVIKDSYYKEFLSWFTWNPNAENMDAVKALLVKPRVEVLKTGDKANELGFTIYYEQNETWVGEREITNDHLLVRSLGVGNADIVFPAYSLLFEYWMWNQHEVTVGVNVVAPKEEATDAAGYALLNKAVFMVEAPIDLTYTINSLVATTDNGAEISFADAKFNTNSRTIEFDLPEGTNYVEFPEGFLTFRGENNTILRSNALTLFVGNATSIDGLIALGEKVQIFDLQGRRVSAESLIAGQTYVINGTKQIVK